jgi:Methyltransferase FkbM domain
VQTHAATTFSAGLSLLKIDVEGFEPALLVGAQTTLSSPTLAPRVIALEVSVDRWRDRFGATAGEVLALIVRHGYEVVFPPEAVGGFDKLVAFCEASAGGNPDVVFVKQ